MDDEGDLDWRRYVDDNTGLELLAALVRAGRKEGMRIFKEMGVYEIENVGFALVLPIFLKGQGWPRVFLENEQNAEKCRLGGGRGRGNPPPRRLVWRFWEVWRVWKLRTASTRQEARGLGGFR